MMVLIDNMMVLIDNMMVLIDNMMVLIDNMNSKLKIDQMHFNTSYHFHSQRRNRIHFSINLNQNFFLKNFFFVFYIIKKK